MKKARDQKGFTLIELVLAVSLSTIIAGAIFVALRAGEEQTDQSNWKMTIQESAREALYKMNQEIRQSAPDRVTVGTKGVSLQFQVPDPSAPVDSSYNIDWTNAHTIQYAIGGTGTQLVRTNTTTGATSILANDVTGVTFTGSGAQPTTVTITVSVQRTLSSGRVVPVQPLQVVSHAEVRNATS